jgi:hypothetical protein
MLFHCRDHARRKPKVENRESRRRRTTSASRDVDALEENHCDGGSPLPDALEGRGRGNELGGSSCLEFEDSAGSGGAGTTGLYSGAGLQLPRGFRTKGRLPCLVLRGLPLGGDRVYNAEGGVGFPNRDMGGPAAIMDGRTLDQVLVTLDQVLVTLAVQ